MVDMCNLSKFKRASGSEIEFFDDKVTKRQAAELGCLEKIKTERAQAIGEATSIFRVPRILSSSIDNGSITFERLHGLQNLMEAASCHRSPAYLLERVGRALAAIHNQLILPEDFSAPISDLGFSLQTKPVYVHGDFSWENVLFQKEQDEVVIIDWATAPWLDKRGTLGPPFVDLGILLHGLFIRRPFAPHCISNPEALGRIFLRSYSAESLQGFRLEEFQRYFSALFSIYLNMRRKQIGELRFFAYSLSFWRLKAFVQKLRMTTLMSSP